MGPSGTLTGALTGALTGTQKVFQQRWYFSEPLVACRRSIDKPLGLPCGAYATTRGANAWAEPSLVGTRLLCCSNFLIIDSFDTENDSLILPLYHDVLL